MFKNQLAAAVSLLFVTGWCDIASSQDYTEIVAFGASLTDSGNVADVSRLPFGFSVPPSPPYYASRFSNGPSWLDFLADHLGVERPVASEVGGKNYAYGSATTGTVDNPLRNWGLLDMDDQVRFYLFQDTPTGNELFVIPGWASLNDFRNEQLDPALSVEFISTMITDLADAGARDLLVGNSIFTPRATHPELLQSFNDLLAVELDDLRNENPGLRIFEFDATAAFGSVLADPAALGILNVTDSACADCGFGTNPNPTEIANSPNGYLFWDDASHFTTPVHEYLAAAAFRSVPEPSGIYPMAFAMAWMWCFRYRAR